LSDRKILSKPVEFSVTRSEFFYKSVIIEMRSINKLNKNTTVIQCRAKKFIK
jgi:hypothetical protein